MKICPRCKNSEEQFFYTDEFGEYCRKCVEFGRVNVDTKLKIKTLPTLKRKVQYQLSYTLSTKQKEIADACVKFIQSKKNVVIKACCGSGKTEMILPLIQYCFDNHLTIGISIPRRQVVLELKERFKQIFPSVKVVAVCKDYTRITSGELIVCTTHQLHRYYQAFDILVIDEVDAFPFHNNTVLQQIAKNAYKQNVVHISATSEVYENFEVLCLYERYHQRKLIVPKVIFCFDMLQYAYLLYFIRKNLHLTIFVFVPTIAVVSKVTKFLKRFFTAHSITSKSEDKEKILYSLKNSNQKILVTTTIMERGITIADATVIVLKSNHVVFHSSTLIQIAGRVDRAKESYGGSVVFLTSHKTSAIKKCITTIKEMNQ